MRINEVLAVSTAFAARSMRTPSRGTGSNFTTNCRSRSISPAGTSPMIRRTSTNGRFPNATIPPSGYLLVFASGSGATPANGRRTRISASARTASILFSRVLTVSIASDFNPPELFPNATWGVRGGGTETGHLRTPTPGALNSAIAAAGRNDVIFSVPHGFKTARLPADTHRHRSRLHHPLYARRQRARRRRARSIPRRSISRPSRAPRSPARASSGPSPRIADAAYTPVATQTYLFVNGVAGPNTDGVVGQTNFVAAIKNHATYGPLLDDACSSLPAVSLVINNSADLPYAETESSIELFDPRAASRVSRFPPASSAAAPPALAMPKAA